MPCFPQPGTEERPTRRQEGVRAGGRAETKAVGEARRGPRGWQGAGGLTRDREEGAAEGWDAARPGGPSFGENHATEAFSYMFLGSAHPGAPPQLGVLVELGCTSSGGAVPAPLLPRSILELGQERWSRQETPESLGRQGRRQAGVQGQGATPRTVTPTPEWLTAAAGVSFEVCGVAIPALQRSERGDFYTGVCPRLFLKRKSHRWI